MRILNFSFLLISYLISSSSSWAQEAEPTTIEDVELSTTVFSLEELGLPDPNGVLRVQGDRLWNSFFISAERIEFEPGSRIVFSQDAIAMRGNLFVMANEIVSLSQENPGAFAWAAPQVALPPEIGSAPGVGGYPGDEVVGANGATGPSGNTGYAGADGPSLTLVVGDPNSPIIIDLSGQPGGQGGPGGTGGRGGVGGNGRSASQNLFNCIRGAGDGARGGNGGNGGPGGQGGDGGDGGTFYLITSDENLAIASSLYRVMLAPGSGGNSGTPGNGGPGGDGGQGGAQQLPYCQGNGSNGQPGALGATGANGQTGNPGQPGDYLIGGLDVDALEQLIQ